MTELDNRLALPEVAAALGIKVQTLYQWHYAGKHGDQLPIRKGLNGRLFCLQKDVQRFREIYRGN